VVDLVQAVRVYADQVADDANGDSARQNTTMVGDGHVLTFGAPAPTGRLDPGSWTVSGVSHETWLSSLASLHEATHAQLNFGTAWGQLLQAMWLLPDKAEVLRKLVERCVRTHEAFATHAAAVQMAGRDSAPTVEQVLARYPTYQHHLREALSVGPPAPIERRWRASAVEAALTACMQADVLTVLFDAPMDRFMPSRLRDHHGPDSHLNVLVELGVGFWDGFDQVAAATFGQERWSVLRSADLPAPIGAAERELARLCSKYVAEKLRAMGRPTLDVPTVLATLPRIVGELQRAGQSLTVDRDPTALFDLERLQLRAPLPARVRTVADGRRGDLKSAAPAGRHGLLTVRRAGVLRRQFALRNDPLPTDDQPVVAIRVRAGDEVALYWVRSPKALPAVELANISLTCARDQTWGQRWKEAIDRTAHLTILIDTPFSQSLDALLTGTTGFRYAVEPLLAGTPLWAYVCAVDGFPPLVLPCAVTRASALQVHTRSRTGGQRPADLSAVVDVPEAVLAIVRRIVADESVIDHGS
jgi:hypothetical protein